MTPYFHQTGIYADMWNQQLQNGDADQVNGKSEVGAIQNQEDRVSTIAHRPHHH